MAPSLSLVRFGEQLAGSDSVEEIQRRSLESLDQLFEHCASAAYVFHPRTGATESVVASGVSEYFLSRYEEVGRHEDPVQLRAVDTGRVATNDGLMSVSDWRALPVFRDVCSLHDLTHVVHAPILDGDSITGMLALGRHRNAGRFSDTELALIDAVARLLGVALAGARQRAEAQRHAHRMELALEHGEEPVVVTDLRAGRRTANAAARRVLGGLQSIDGGIEEAIAAPAEVGGEEVTQLPVRLGDGAGALLRVRSVRTADPSVVVSFLRLERPAALAERSAFACLTPREREVAELVALGLRDAEVASRLYLSPYTVTKYLSVIYRKLGMRSRVELARAVLGESR